MPRISLTQLIQHSILTRMNTEEHKVQMERGLDILEARIDELLKIVEKLTQNNRSLLSKQERLIAERAELLDKTDMARSRVESMITRLKSMEANL